MRAKKITALVIAVVFMFTISIPAFGATPSLELQVNGSKVKLDGTTKVIGTVPMISATLAAKILGGDASYDTKAKKGIKGGSVYLLANGSVLKGSIGSAAVKYNSVSTTLKNPIKWSGKTVQLPLKNVIETFGGSVIVTKNGNKYIATITTPGEIGKISNLTGSVFVTPLGGKEVPGANGMIFADGAIIRTASGGSAELKTSEGSVLKLGSETEMKVVKIDENLSTDVRMIHFQLNMGEFWASVTKQSPGSKFLVSLKSGTDSIDYSADSTSFYLATKDTKLTVASGVVIVNISKGTALLRGAYRTISEVTDESLGIQAGTEFLFTPGSPTGYEGNIIDLQGPTSPWGGNTMGPWLGNTLGNQQNNLAGCTSGLTDMLGNTPREFAGALNNGADLLTENENSLLDGQFVNRQILPNLGVLPNPDAQNNILSSQRAVGDLANSNDPDLSGALPQTELDTLLDMEQGTLKQIRENFDLAGGMPPGELLNMIPQSDMERLMEMARQFESMLPAGAAITPDLMPQLRIPAGVQIPEFQIPPGFSMPEGFVIPQGLDLAAFGSLPEGIVLPPDFTPAKMQEMMSKFADGVVLPPNFDLGALTGGAGLPPGCVLPPGISIPSGFTLPAGIDIPKFVNMGSGVNLPKECNFDPGFMMPEGINIPAGFTMPSDIDFAEGFTMPSGINFAQGFTMPAGMDFASGFTMPTGMNFGEGFVMPKDVLLPEGFQIPTGMNFEQGFIIPEGVVLPEGFKPPTGVMFDPNFVPPTGMTIPDGMMADPSDMQQYQDLMNGGMGGTGGIPVIPTGVPGGTGTPMPTPPPGFVPPSGGFPGGGGMGM